MNGKLKTPRDQLISGSLAYYRHITAEVLGESSPAVAFLDAKIAREGESELCLGTEEQMVESLISIHEKGFQS